MTGDEKPGWLAVRIRGGRRWWFEWCTPTWHAGRGPYISVVLGVIAIYRGY